MSRVLAERQHHLPLGGRTIVVVLPIVFAGMIPTFGLTNLVWGSIFGFPGILFHEARIPHPLWTDVIWILAWPGVALFLTGKIVDALWRTKQSVRLAAAALYAASLFCLVPAAPTLTAPMGQPFAHEDLPLYLRLLVY